MTCRLFHDWSKWSEPYMPDTLVAKFDLYGAYRREQKKICSRCRKQKVRRI